MNLIALKKLNNIKSRFSTESIIDPNILADFIKEDALTPSLKRPEKKESITIKLYFNLANIPFDNKRDVPLIANAFTNAALKLGDHPEMVYQFHLYLLISGKKTNVLPSECKGHIEKALDHLNKRDTKLFNFSALSRAKRKFDNMKNQMSKVLISAQFSADITNDIQGIKLLIDKLLITMMGAKSLENLSIKHSLLLNELVML